MAEQFELTGDPLPEGVSLKAASEAIQDAQDAFWAVIASRFPEVKTGDFGPEESLAFDHASEQAVGTWLYWNHPGSTAKEDWATPEENRQALKDMTAEEMEPSIDAMSDDELQRQRAES